MKIYFQWLCLFSLMMGFQQPTFGQFSNYEYADSAQILLVFDNEQDTAAINELKNELQAVALGVSPLTRVHLWQIPLDTVTAYGGPIGVQNHAVGKAVVKGGDINFSTNTILPVEDDDDDEEGDPCYHDTAFTCSPGDNPVLVAFTDTGLDGFSTGEQDIWQHRHLEFDSRLWQNPGEAGTSLFSDDDANGFEDDVQGWDFTQADNLPIDENQHGTHTAGTTAGLLLSNEETLARLMILQTHNQVGEGSLWHLVNALDYAFRNNVKIVNMSLAYLSPVNSFNKPTVLEYLMDFGKVHTGTLFIAAAGNDTLNIDNPLTLADGTPVRYNPANQTTDNLIVVAAGDCQNELAPFSNYGATSVDLAAPGLNIYSTILSGNYDYLSGTSMAVPHVTAAAVLSGSQLPTFHWKRIKSDILNLSLPASGLSEVTVSGKMLAFCDHYSGNSTLEVTIKANQILCLGGNATLMAKPSGGTSPYTYQWSNGGTTVQTSVSVAGFYTVTLTDGSGTTTSETVEINSFAAPIMDIQQDSMQCFESSALLTIGNPTSGAQYHWSNGTTGTTIEVSPMQTSVYTVTATLPSGCSNTATVQVPVGGLNVVLPAVATCSGDCTELSPMVSGADGPYIYLWNTGETTQSIIKCPTSNKTYRVTVTSGNGCTGIATVLVTVRPKPLIAAMANQSICPCASAVLNANVSSGTSPYSYVWQPGNATTSGITVAPAVTTLYIVSVTDAQGCTASRSVKVSLKCRPPGALSSDINPENQTATFNWQPVCTSTAWQMRWKCGGNTWNNVNIPNPAQLSVMINLPVNCNNLTWQVRGRCCNNSWSTWNQAATLQAGMEDRSVGVQAPVSIVYPNPVAEHLFLHLEVDEDNMEAAVFSTTGQLMLKARLSPGDLHKIEVGDLPAGVYLIKIDNINRTVVEKFMKL